MKKSALLLAIGKSPKDADEDEEIADEDVEPEVEESDGDEDEAIDTFLDDSLDVETRREAFRRAVKLCSKGGY